jgi:hypothetical protein
MERVLFENEDEDFGTLDLAGNENFGNRVSFSRPLIFLHCFTLPPSLS